MFAECNDSWVRFLRSLKSKGRPWPNQNRTEPWNGGEVPFAPPVLNDGVFCAAALRRVKGVC